MHDIEYTPTPPPPPRHQPPPLPPLSRLNRRQSRDQVSGVPYGGPPAKYGMDESRIGTVISGSDLNDVLDTQGRSALELATSSRRDFSPLWNGLG